MKYCVTGGASFIGSHLVEALLKEGSEVVVLDDMSSGALANLKEVINDPKLEIYQPDLRAASPSVVAAHLRHVDAVFHLAADHGGRGYVETQQVNCSNNFAIDNNVFQACRIANVKKIIFASSGCAYPIHLQGSETASGPLRLKEDNIATRPLYEAMANSGNGKVYDPDGLYGWAKLMGELTLEEMYKECGIQSVSCRFFTVYGPRAKINHAIISFIARAFIQQDPWVVWGDGTQVRNWTYVDDIVQGLMLSRNLTGCQALNIGTDEYLTVNDAVSYVINQTNARYYKYYTPRIEFDHDKPTGPMVRVADATKYRSLGGTLTPFYEGLEKTMDWFFSNHTKEEIRATFDRLLIARK